MSYTSDSEYTSAEESYTYSDVSDIPWRSFYVNQELIHQLWIFSVVIESFQLS